MARRALSPACLAVVQAVQPWVGEPVTVACSGGPDSLALAAAVAHLMRSRPVDADAVIVDHGLQPGSAAVAAEVAARLQQLGLAASVRRVMVDPHAPAGLEAAARAARYRALSGPRTVLLGHTLDDQAETVLLGLARGSGARSLAGMAQTVVRDGTRFARPLLTLRRSGTEQACRDWGLTVWRDPHNADPRFLRSRLRAALPVLEEALGPGVPESLARTASLLRADADLLDECAEAAWQERPGERTDDGLDLDWLSGLPTALRTRLIRRWLAAQQVPGVTAGHVAAVLLLVDDYRGQTGIDLPGGVRVRRTGRRLVCAPG